MSNHAGQTDLTTLVLAPVLVEPATVVSTANPADMKGWDRVRFDISIGAMVNGGTLAVKVVESNESNLGNATDITNAALTTVPNTQNASVQQIDVYRPTKRYVGVSATVASANVTFGVTATRFRGTGTIPATRPTNNQYVAVAAN